MTSAAERTFRFARWSARVAPRCLWLTLALAVAAASTQGVAPPGAGDAASAPAPACEPAASRPQHLPPAPRPVGPVPFQPGVRIDWPRRQVEVDATVVLRQGLLELLACSPQTREHEAILRIDARPLHLFHALGLIGLTPGHPTLYHDETGRSIPAAGDPVEIEVRCPAGGKTLTVPAEQWLIRHDGQPVGRLPWVFAGSVLLENDAIAADFEGTVVAVVDFSSALVALPEHHTDRNAELWLRPNTEAIPPVGTRVALLFRPGPVEVALDALGRLSMAGRRVTLAEAAVRLKAMAAGGDSPAIRVKVEPGCPEAEVRSLEKLLEHLEVTLPVGPASAPATTGPAGHEPEAWIGWLADRFVQVLFPPAGAAATRPPDRR